MGQIKAEYFQPVRLGSYKIHNGDVLEISIEEQPDTEVASVPLSPNGYLYYLMVKPFKAEGLTLDELRIRLEKELEEFFLEPHVFVDVVNRAKNTYHILGKVSAPGTFSLGIPVKLREAISLAGGLQFGNYRGERQNLASLKKSYIIRDSKKLPIDFQKLVKDEEASQNIYLKPNDYIYIASNMAREVYILGEVGSHARFYTDDLTLMQVVSSVRYRESATRNKVVILRGKLSDSPELIEVNIKEILAAKARDVYLKADDIIYFPEKPFRFTQDLIKAAIRAYVGSFSSDAGRYISSEKVFKNGTSN
ncbi:MAG: polysaccharide biosynthesis/export family protein [Lentisphaeraceae bacterium]|nr:polysaccharide biosynthesis/export family protein [Lentisphaeraceae bacterium]